MRAFAELQQIRFIHSSSPLFNEHLDSTSACRHDWSDSGCID